MESLSEINCVVATRAQKTFALALSAASDDFANGANVSLHFVGKNGVLLADIDGDQSADLAISLTGLKLGVAGLVSYVESGEMFT